MSQVFAMVASMEAFVPILSSMIYSNLYNATIELAYPWQGSFYFLSIGLTIIGNNICVDESCQTSLTCLR